MPETPKLVELNKKEYDVVNDGKGLRVRVPLYANKTFSRSGLLAQKQKFQELLVEIDEALAKMDELNVE